jgi:nitrous oxidase accessory protein NosD
LKEKGIMKNKIVAGIVVLILVLGLMHVTLNFAPLVFSEPSSGRREVWRILDVSNTLPYNTLMNLNVTANSRKGVYIACSANVTTYFENLTYWQGLGYMTYMDWLNGTSTHIYHWDEMDWYVSNGSLTPITYSEIQFWGPMYFDSGGGVNYTTFMGNTFMADFNLSEPNSDPDIVSQANWTGSNQIRIINGLMVPASTTIEIVFEFVITEPGAFTFSFTPTPGITLTPSTLTMGGMGTIMVPDDKPTIHEAIDVALAGDTIVVAAGTYTETQVLIDKPIRLIGSGVGTIIDGQNVAPPTIGLVRITAGTGNVTFGGFTLKNAGKTSGVRVAIFAQSTSVGLVYTISNNTIIGTNDPNDDQDYGIYAYLGSESLVFTNNTINQTGANPVLIERHRGPIDISSNTLDVGVWGSTAIHVMTYAGDDITTLQRISGNTIDMGTGGPFDTDHACTGITFAGSYKNPGGPDLGDGRFTSVQVTGNRIINVQSYRRGITLANMASGNLTAGEIVSPVVTSNTISGAAGSSANYGLRLLGLVSNAMVLGNNITGNAYGVYVENATATLSYNNIFGNSLYGVLNGGTGAVSATYDWWGNETGPTNTANPSGLGDRVSDNVPFGPWLIKTYPPLAPISFFYVNPPLVALQAPAMGTMFTVDVTIANASMMYGFQFTLRWNSAYIDLTNPATANRIPTVWGSNYIAQPSYNLTEGRYSLFEAAKSPAPSFNGTTVVASLTFRSRYDPLYPNNVTCGLTLENVNMSDPLAKSILHVVQNGTYSCYSVKPKILFMASAYSAKKVPTEFDATINVTNVVNLYSLDFTGTFNSTLLNVININVTNFPGSPAVNMGWDNNLGYFHVSAIGINPPVNGSMVIARVRFKVQQGFAWNTETSQVSCSLDFSMHQLNTSIGPIDHDAISGTYVYRPVPGDLSMDGLVDIVDLLTVAGLFGTSPGVPYVPADLNHDGVIDIFDVILVAHNFGRTEP